MKLDRVLKGLPAADVVAAVYFAGRYIKQASGANHAKNVFQDDARSLPSEQVVAITMNVVKAVEQELDKKSEQIVGDELHRVLNELSSVALAYEDHASPVEIESALAIVDELEERLLVAGQ